MNDGESRYCPSQREHRKSGLSMMQQNKPTDDGTKTELKKGEFNLKKNQEAHSQNTLYEAEKEHTETRAIWLIKQRQLQSGS